MGKIDDYCLKIKEMCVFKKTGIFGAYCNSETPANFAAMRGLENMLLLTDILKKKNFSTDGHRKTQIERKKAIEYTEEEYQKKTLYSFKNNY